MKASHSRSLLGALVVGLVAITHVLAGEHLASEHVRIMDAWSRALPPVSTNGAAYFTAMNEGNEAGRIVGASSPIAKRVEIHNHEMNDGVVKMTRVADGLPVPAGGSVELAPGGLHLMLMGLNEPLVPGKAFPLTLRFEDGGTIETDVTVLSLDEAAKKATAMGHGETKGMEGARQHGSGHGHTKQDASGSGG